MTPERAATAIAVAIGMPAPHFTFYKRQLVARWDDLCGLRCGLIIPPEPMEIMHRFDDLLDHLERDLRK